MYIVLRLDIPKRFLSIDNHVLKIFKEDCLPSIFKEIDFRNKMRFNPSPNVMKISYKCS